MTLAQDGYKMTARGGFMSIQAEVRDQISQTLAGTVFGYDALPAYKGAPGAVVKAVSRLIQAGELQRLMKGQFYKPKKGILGDVPLKDTEKLRPLLYKGGRRVGYITGAGLYNRLGLTSQVPGVLTLAREKAGKDQQLGTFSVRVVQARAPVKDKNIPLLELLDALKDIRRIPDTTPDDALRGLALRIDALPDMERRRMVRLAGEYYPPATRALLGMLLQGLDQNGCGVLKRSLNPISRYKVALDTQKWPLAREWNIS
jgi:hypothetical protein